MGGAEGPSSVEPVGRLGDGTLLPLSALPSVHHEERMFLTLSH